MNKVDGLKQINSFKIIGIVGTRKRNRDYDKTLIANAFKRVYTKGDWICSGGCERGADKFAEVIAIAQGIPMLTFYPNWNAYKKGAGLARNTDIAKYSDILIACVAMDRKGGTEDTITKFLEFKGSDANLIIL